MTCIMRAKHQTQLFFLLLKENKLTKRPLDLLPFAWLQTELTSNILALTSHIHTFLVTPPQLWAASFSALQPFP